MLFRQTLLLWGLRLRLDGHVLLVARRSVHLLSQLLQQVTGVLHKIRVNRALPCPLLRVHLVEQVADSCQIDDNVAELLECAHRLRSHALLLTDMLLNFAYLGHVLTVHVHVGRTGAPSKSFPLFALQ